MTFFSNANTSHYMDCQHHNDAWRGLINFILTDSSWSIYRSNPESKFTKLDPNYPIEAKALAVISMAHRHIKTVEKLINQDTNEGRLVFLETYALLMPMLELVGHSRTGTGKVTIGNHNRDYGKSSHSLWSGILWLQNVHDAPPITFTDSNGAQCYFNNNVVRINSNRLNDLAQYMRHRDTGPMCSDLYFLRHYHIHGTKNHDEPSVDIEAALNYELPAAIAKLAKSRLKEYWVQLVNDHGNPGCWHERLSVANIHPFIIPGSDIFDYGYLEPDIFSVLE